MAAEDGHARCVGDAVASQHLAEVLGAVYELVRSTEREVVILVRERVLGARHLDGLRVAITSRKHDARQHDAQIDGKPAKRCDLNGYDDWNTQCVRSEVAKFSAQNCVSN
jgi:hypothetical protein